MLYHISQLLVDHFTVFNALTYVTLRAILAALTAFVISIVFGQKMVNFLQFKQVGQFVRNDGPQTHLKKQGTPTMGGVLILLVIVISILLWTNLKNSYVWVCLFVLIGFGYIGFIDDYRKLIKKDPNGLKAREKFAAQAAIATIASFWLYFLKKEAIDTALLFPFFKNLMLPMGLLFIPWVFIVITGSSNAVNLTDGLDGLAILPVVLVAGGLGVFAYATGNYNFSQYLQMPFIKGSAELVIICAAIFGSGLGFLWFNAHPALVFMGDVGALALGALLGVIAVICRQEIVLAIMGGIFVIEALSVVIQVASYKLTGKRVFRMAPIHHHFELKGWPESRVIVRFWIITVVLVLVGLATLKLR